MALADLFALPKPHYHWAFADNFYPGDANMTQIIRVCGAASVDPGRQSAATMQKIIALAAARGVSVGIVYSAWHQTWPTGQPPTNEGAPHTAELRALIADFETVADLCNSAGVSVSAVFYDSEQWHVDANTAGWNAALTRKYNAAYDLAKIFFPSAKVEWYGSGWQRSQATAGWSFSTIFVGDERRDSLSCDLYTLPEIDRTRQTFSRTVTTAVERGLTDVTPWIALGKGMKPQVDQFQLFVDWDCDRVYSWQMGREINNAFFWDKPNRFAPWSYAKRCIFYPQPFANAYWLKHFIAYCQGAKQILSLE